MDQLFLDVVLLLISGSIEDDCPPPPVSSSIICGATLSKRKVNTRIEVWLGGLAGPEPGWIRSIEHHFAKVFQGNKIYPYRAFKESKDAIASR